MSGFSCLIKTVIANQGVFHLFSKIVSQCLYVSVYSSSCCHDFKCQSNHEHGWSSLLFSPTNHSTCTWNAHLDLRIHLSLLITVFITFNNLSTLFLLSWCVSIFTASPLSSLMCVIFNTFLCIQQPL